jgi:hypothetical protein
VNPDARRWGESTCLVEALDLVHPALEALGVVGDLHHLQEELLYLQITATTYTYT